MRLLTHLVLAGLLTLPCAAGAASLEVTILDSAGRPVRDAVVSVRPASGTGGAPRFAFTPRMSQKDVQFTPGLLVVPVGTTVSFPNFDRVRHHVYSFSKAKKFELKLYGKDETRSVRFDQPGTVAVGCNIHDAMSGFIRVVDTPFAAVSDVRGRASLTGLPPGAARVTVWHSGNRAREGEQLVATVIPASGKGSATVRLNLPTGRR